MQVHYLGSQLESLFTNVITAICAVKVKIETVSKQHEECVAKRASEQMHRSMFFLKPKAHSLPVKSWEHNAYLDALVSEILSLKNELVTLENIADTIIALLRCGEVSVSLSHHEFSLIMNHSRSWDEHNESNKTAT